MDRKSEILDHAAELLQTRGFTAFSYGDLSERLGIRKASIHHHFASKEALGEALCCRFAEGFAGWRRALDESGRRALPKLQAIFAHARGMALDEKICPFGSLQAQWDALPESVRSKVRGLDAGMREWLAELLAEARAQGDLTFEGNAADHASLVLAAMQGGLQHARVHGIDALDRVLAQIWRTLGARPD